MTTPIAAGPLDRRVVPHVVGPWYALPPTGCDQWEVTLGTMRLTINANSHQTAKKVAVSHWAACNGEPEKFKRAIEARIAERWRGGIRARRIVRHNALAQGPGGSSPGPAGAMGSAAFEPGRDDEEEKLRNEWALGEYDNGEDGCPHCGRSRLCICPNGKHRCEKCNWSPELNDYAPVSD